MTFIIILAVLVSVLWILVILIQNPKGGGLASNYAQGNQIFGVERTTEVVEKVTWGGAILIVVLSISAAMFYKSGGTKKTSTKTEKSTTTLPAAPSKGSR